uniref:Receptor-type tyrosine-protein phosphatase epsilon-like n=1 Tax=Crassostrea virginica TaxID=6565 RepID=A0A8B8BQ03_CRAVI|nr:receptor-type tyrosine-protein phosphatase epsilon-like [Crassostrea virginica]
MNRIVILLQLYVLRPALSYDNLVIPGTTPATLSTTYQDYVASRSVDGRPELLNLIADRSCSHSDVNQVSAWLRVDLGRVYSVYQVLTWYRNDRGVLSTTRFRGYSLRVSNDTIFPSDVCFQHDGISDIPISTVNNPTVNFCPRTTRYVWYFNNRAQPGDASQVFLEICEVQITGCEVNHYGENCTFCGIGCETCHITFGCTSCLPGHVIPPSCECPVGRYGVGCSDTCSPACSNSVCDIESGECRDGCVSGYLGVFCNQTCPLGFFGTGCELSCSGNCRDNIPCNHTDGSCDRGCANDWRGPRCNQFAPSPTGAAPGGAVAGPVAGLLVAVIVLAVAAVLTIKFRKKTTPEYRDFVIQRSLKIKRSGTNSSAHLVEGSAGEKSSRGSHYSDRSSNTPRDSYFLTSKEIGVNSISIALKAKSRDSYRIFLDEFKSIPYGEESHIPCSVAKEPRNKSRNRFRTTFPYDHSRVILKSDENDYINANYIQDCSGERKYIASQGPKPNTVADHWLMVWQENVRVIAMLTNLTEGSKKKCEQYWPDFKQEVTYGDITVLLQQENKYAYYVTRQLKLRHKSEAESRLVTQMHYTHWPDHGVPDPVQLMVFYRHVARIKDKHRDNLMLVHCSAGIGRTGTFLALDALYRHGLTQGSFNPAQYVATMRKDRMNMIQNVDQYVVLHFALNESFKGTEGIRRRSVFVQEQSQAKDQAVAARLAQEFNGLLSIKTPYIEADKSAGLSHTALNYTQSVLPVDKYRAVLTSYVAGRTEYYNAVFLPSFYEDKALIAAQYPLEEQAEDFLRLLIDYESNFLISINPLKDILSTRKWLPAESPVTLQTYTLTRTKMEDITPAVRRSDIEIKYDETETHRVHIYELTTWKLNDAVPRDLQMIADVIGHVTKSTEKSESDSPITIISKDGAAGCGVFCAVYNALQQLQQDEEVDLVTIVRQLQIRRPEMIATLEEYVACHQIIAMALDKDYSDSNFAEADNTAVDLYSNVETVYSN